MERFDVHLSREEIVSLAIEIFIKISAITIVAVWAFLIVRPFIMLVIWGIILAVALFPLVRKMEEKFRLKRSLIVTIIVVMGILPLSVPTYMLSQSMVASAKHYAKEIREGSFYVPPPPAKVAKWPLIGKQVHSVWSEASENIEEFVSAYKPQIKKWVAKLLPQVGKSLSAAVGFIAALLIAGVFMVYSETGIEAVRTFFRRLVGEKQDELVDVTTATIRSVMYGIIGIALAQALLALAGMAFMDVPLALVWAAAVLFLAIIQLPPILVLAPVILYVFSHTEPTAATLFALYSVVVATLDSFMKPFVLGRGVDIPMLVVLTGAIGGMLLSGIIGLFVGSVVLALAYKLVLTWIRNSAENEIYKEAMLHESR